MVGDTTWFLVSFLSHRLTRRTDDVALYAGNHGRTSLQDAIRVVNKGLREADMEIASGKAADDGTAYYALVRPGNFITLLFSICFN